MMKAENEDVRSEGEERELDDTELDAITGGKMHSAPKIGEATATARL